MTNVLAAITTSVDWYITGPNDGPGKGLGEGGERLVVLGGGKRLFEGFSDSLELEHLGIRDRSTRRSSTTASSASLSA